MKRTIALTLFLVTLFAAEAQRIFRLIPPDKSFEITFPGEPHHQQDVSDNGRIHVEAHSYSFETTASKFVLTYVHLSPPPVDLRASDALDTAINGTVANVRGKLLDSKAVTLGGNPAKTVKIGVGANTLIDGRFIYVKPRVYQLLLLHRKGVTPAYEQQFFDSFSVTPEWGF